MFSERSANGPRVREILAVEDLSADPSSGTFTVTDLYCAENDDALRWTGALPQRLINRLRGGDTDLAALLRSGAGVRQ
jgi:hypothetical protein